MIRKTFTLSVLLSVLVLSQFAEAMETPDESTSQQPNIIFLFADDQRADTIAAHGNEHIQTPNLDQLARQGFSFRRNYCAGSYSGAVCIASRAMLMTGRHWHRIQSQPNWQSWTDMPTMPGLLSEKAGYETFIVGKWHNGLKTLNRSFQNGESVYMGGMLDHTSFEIQDYRDGKLTEPRKGNDFSSTVFADSAIKFINNANSDKPYFLYVAFTAPHDPRNPPEKYRKAYYNNRPPLPENFLPEHPFTNSKATNGNRDENLAAWPRTKDVVSDQLCEYYGLVTQLDEQVGRIVKAVSESSGADNTYFVYTADHGLAMGSHGLLGKQNVYEQSMSSPLIVRGPGIPAGKSSNAMTYVHDLFSTVLGMAGVEIPDEADSIDLSAIWLGEKESVRDSLFIPFKNEQRTINDGRWKLHLYPQINHRLLFDLKNDPHELVNLAESNDHSSHVGRLTEMIQQWREEVGDKDPLRVANPEPMGTSFNKAGRNPDRWQPDWIREKYFDGRAPKQRN